MQSPLAGPQDLALLFDLGGLTAKVTEVVKLGSTHVTTGHHFDLSDGWRVDGECSLHAHAVANFLYGKGFAYAASSTGDYVTLEYLGAFLVSFDNANVNLHVVSRTEIRYVGTQAVFVDKIGRVHGSCSKQCRSKAGEGVFKRLGNASRSATVGAHVGWKIFIARTKVTRHP
jgi:hypothetical protein